MRETKWVPDEEDVEWGNHLIHYYCPECKKQALFNETTRTFFLTNFCYNCGADLRINFPGHRRKVSVDE